MHSDSLRYPIGIVVALVLAGACSSGTSPSTIPQPSPSATLSPAPAPTPTAASCPLGYGTGHFTCQGDPAPGLVGSVDGAIDKLVQDKPGLFDLQNPSGDHGFLVRDADAFYAGVMGNLAANGLCSQLDFPKETLSVKSDNTYSEDYHLLTSQSRIRWGIKAYVVSCTPANFPLTPDQAVARVTVSFYGVQCANQDGPNAALNLVPMGCRGAATATPKDAIGHDVPYTNHSLDIQWFWRDGEGTVATGVQDTAQPFNFLVYGVHVGTFSVCATVSGKTGCLNGQVIPAQ
ncbi:MAG TPA: hypothetical protein VN461_16900 [Vicinamibacteria bacterium]|jgi:hypothetical protein|nr:hypothetical protein [Vicinamibacteria bacterium]